MLNSGMVVKSGGDDGEGVKVGDETDVMDGVDASLDEVSELLSEPFDHGKFAIASIPAFTVPFKGGKEWHLLGDIVPSQMGVPAAEDWALEASASDIDRWGIGAPYPYSCTVEDGGVRRTLPYPNPPPELRGSK